MFSPRSLSGSPAGYDQFQSRLRRVPHSALRTARTNSLAAPRRAFPSIGFQQPSGTIQRITTRSNCTHILRTEKRRKNWHTFQVMFLSDSRFRPVRGLSLHGRAYNGPMIKARPRDFSTDDFVHIYIHTILFSAVRYFFCMRCVAIVLLFGSVMTPIFLPPLVIFKKRTIHQHSMTVL